MSVAKHIRIYCCVIQSSGEMLDLTYFLCYPNTRLLYVGPIFIRTYVIRICERGFGSTRKGSEFRRKVSDTKTSNSLKTFLNREGLSRASKSENR